MAIDFASLVLGPCMSVFAENVTVEPAASQPSAPSYAARGVYDERPVDVETADGQIFSSAAKRLGIAFADFTVPPAQGDFITVRGLRFRVEDLDDDGQGGTVLTLAEIRS